MLVQWNRRKIEWTWPLLSTNYNQSRASFLDPKLCPTSKKVIKWYRPSFRFYRWGRFLCYASALFLCFYFFTNLWARQLKTSSRRRNKIWSILEKEDGHVIGREYFLGIAGFEFYVFNLSQIKDFGFLYWCLLYLICLRMTMIIQLACVIFYSIKKW